MPLGTLDDTDLVARALAGDDAAFAEIIHRHHDSLWRFAHSVLRNGPDADEATQDTFVAAHRNLGSFRHDAKLRTWLHTICYRQCLGRLRRKRLTQVPLDEARTVSAAHGDDAVRVALADAIDDLPDDNRAAFVLVDILGFSREDAAGLIGVPGNTMRARVARARVLLADALTDPTDVETP